MKKRYLKPNMYINNIEPETMLAISYEVGTETNGKAETKERKNNWGDLWSDNRE